MQRLIHLFPRRRRGNCSSATCQERAAELGSPRTCINYRLLFLSCAELQAQLRLKELKSLERRRTLHCKQSNPASAQQNFCALLTRGEGAIWQTTAMEPLEDEQAARHPAAPAHITNSAEHAVHHEAFHHPVRSAVRQQTPTQTEFVATSNQQAVLQRWRRAQSLPSSSLRHGALTQPGCQPLNSVLGTRIVSNASRAQQHSQTPS